MPTPLAWIWINLKIGALSFGGSGRMILFQDALVEKHRWLSEDELLECLSIAQILPGPNLVNLSAYISQHLFQKTWVAVASVVALTLPGALLGLALISFALLSSFDRLLQGFSLGSIALFLVFVARMAPGALGKTGVPGRVIIALSVAGASLAGVPLFYTLSVGIAASLFWEFTWAR